MCTRTVPLVTVEDGGSSFFRNKATRPHIPEDTNRPLINYCKNVGIPTAKRHVNSTCMRWKLWSHGFPISFAFADSLGEHRNARHMEGCSEGEVWLRGWRRERFSRNFILDPMKQPARSLWTGRFWHQRWCERVERSSVCSARRYRWRYFTPNGSICSILPSQQNCLLHWSWNVSAIQSK
jgi:hypothetical protein